jgi:hypothetical protein
LAGLVDETLASNPLWLGDEEISDVVVGVWIIYSWIVYLNYISSGFEINC